MFTRLAIAAIALSLAPLAVATPIIVDPTTETSDVDVSINSATCARWAPCRMRIDMSDDLDDAYALMHIGDEWTFDFFDIVLRGLGEIHDATVTATLGFAEPTALTASSGTGSFFSLFGIVTGGSLYWDQPDYINLEDGSILIVEFEDVADIFVGNRIPVSASVRRVAQVPEPTTLALFGGGLLLLGFASLRRRRRVDANV